MGAVIASLVAVVLLVLVVVALGKRSMSRRESFLPPERLKEMAEREEMTQTRSTDEFAAHEPRMSNFSPDFSPIDEVKQPRPVRTGQRGKRGVDEWGNPSSDVEDEEFWANIRSDADEGGFGADGTVAARKGAARPVEGAPQAQSQPQAQQARQPARRQAEAADPNAKTVQAPLPPRPVPAAKSGLADLVGESTQAMDAVELEPEPKRSSRRAKPAAASAPVPPRAPSASDLADQRTVTFSTMTGSSTAGAADQTQPTGQDTAQVRNSGRSGRRGSRSAARQSAAQPAPAVFPASPPLGSDPASAPLGGGPSAPLGNPVSAPFGGSPSAPLGGSPSAPLGGNAPAPFGGPSAPLGGGAGSTSLGTGAFPAVPNGSMHGAPTSDPFPATPNAADPLDPKWPAPASSGSWPATPQRDVLDESATAGSSWPAFEGAYGRDTDYPASYEVRSGWAVADDSDPLTTAPTPASGTPTVPARTVSYDDVLAAPVPPSAAPVAVPASAAPVTGPVAPLPSGPVPVPPAPGVYPAYETGDYAAPAGGAWPETPASNASWPAYGEMSGDDQQQTPRRGGRRRAPEQQDYPDYYR
ncbi:hypothetical protein [Nonomuraea longicatena]|uniref:Uncharacterized protein n=1 Tax=Nonomuraea longicatena TaxID=83682 RepID=A0ABN1NM48_9ACTN